MKLLTVFFVVIVAQTVLCHPDRYRDGKNNGSNGSATALSSADADAADGGDAIAQSSAVAQAQRKGTATATADSTAEADAGGIAVAQSTAVVQVEKGFIITGKETIAYSPDETSVADATATATATKKLKKKSLPEDTEVITETDDGGYVIEITQSVIVRGDDFESAKEELEAELNEAGRDAIEDQGGDATLLDDGGAVAVSNTVATSTGRGVATAKADTDASSEDNAEAIALNNVSATAAGNSVATADSGSSASSAGNSSQAVAVGNVASQSQGPTDEKNRKNHRW